MNDLLTQQTIRNRRRSFLEPAIVFLIAYLFYLITRTENFSAAHDSITYLVGIIHGEHLFHPHHLLYHIFANKWLVFWQAIFPKAAEYAIIEAFTAVWGAATLALVYRILRSRFLLERIISITGIAIIGFSYGMWFYSTNIEVYMPSVFFMLLLLNSIPEKLNTSSLFLLSILHSVAILFHQVNIIFSLIIVFLILRDRQTVKIFRGLLIYFITGFILVGGFYFFGGWIAEGHNDLQSWTTWIRGYTQGHDYWRPWNSDTPQSVITGSSHAFIGGHFLFQLPVVRNYLVNSLEAHSLSDELFLSSAIDPAMAWFLTGLCIAIIILIGFLIVRFIKQYGWKYMGRVDSFMMLTLCTILLYSFFFSLWMPEILEFWILQMVLFWIVLIGGSSRPHFVSGRPGNPAILLTIAISLFCINYFGSMRWLADKKYDWYNLQTEALGTHLSPGDIIILEDPWIIDGYIRYLTGNPVFALEDIKENSQRLPDGRVFFIQKDTTMADKDIQGLLKRKFSDAKLHLPGGQTVYILE